MLLISSNQTFYRLNALKGYIDWKIPIHYKNHLTHTDKAYLMLHAVFALINSWAVAEFVCCITLYKFNCFCISDNLLRLILDCHETVPVWSDVLFSSLCLVLAVQLSDLGVQKNETGLKTLFNAYLPFCRLSCCGLISNQASKERRPAYQYINALQIMFSSFLLIPLLGSIILYNFCEEVFSISLRVSRIKTDTLRQ